MPAEGLGMNVLLMREERVAKTAARLREQGRSERDRLQLRCEEGYQ